MYAFSCRILKFSIVFKPKNNKKIIQQANATAECVCWKWIHRFYNVQFQKISILPPQKGLEFPGGQEFYKAKKFKEMYEA